MIEILKDFYKVISIIDLLYIIITFLSLIKCVKRGFVLSILSMTKWFLTYLITLMIFPKVKPYLSSVVKNEYILDICLGISIFVVVLFLVLILSKALKKVISYSGIGNLDTLFGFFFGFIRAYIISICLFSGGHVVYNYDKWPINLNKSYVFPYLKKGSNYLLKEFPDEKTYQNSKEKIKEL